MLIYIYVFVASLRGSLRGTIFPWIIATHSTGADDSIPPCSSSFELAQHANAAEHYTIYSWVKE